MINLISKQYHKPLCSFTSKEVPFSLLVSAVWLRYTTAVLRIYFNYTVEQKHGGRSMIFQESMYHNMRIHVIFWHRIYYLSPIS